MIDKDLYMLSYRSRSAILDVGCDVKTELDNILASARRNNAGMRVTGALIFSEENFAQVLEGPKSSLDMIFSKIRSDPRHRDVTILNFDPVERRSFPNWSMAFTLVAGESWMTTDLGDGAQSSSAVPPKTLVTILRGLIARHVAVGGEALSWPLFSDQ